MEDILSQEETSRGVLGHDAVRSLLEALTKKNKRKIVPFQMNSTTKLDNILQFMDLLPL